MTQALDMLLFKDGKIQSHGYYTGCLHTAS